MKLLKFYRSRCWGMNTSETLHCSSIFHLSFPGHTFSLKTCISIERSFSSVQSLSHVRFFATPWTVACQASLWITNSWRLLKLMSVESMMPSNHLILCCPLLLLPSIFPSIQVFSNLSGPPIRWPKDWNFSFSISPSNEYSQLISFKIDWFDIFAVWGTLKSLLQHHSLKTSVLQHSALFMVHLSHPYMTTGKHIALICRPLSAKWRLCFSVGCHCFPSKEKVSGCGGANSE